MVHDRQRLQLSFEALHYRFVVHPGFDQLQCDLPPHRQGLLRQPHLPHAAFTQLADKLKTLCEDLPRFQAGGKANPIQVCTRSIGQRGGLQEAGGNVGIGIEQGLHLLPQRWIGRTSAIQKGRALPWSQFQRLLKHIPNFLPAFWGHVSAALLNS